MTRIVTSVPRPKRPPKKRKAAPLGVPAIVRSDRKREEAPKPPAAPAPANDDRKPPPPGARKSAIVTTISRKRQRQLRAGYTAAEPDDDPKGDALVKAFMARMIRPPGS